MKCGRISETFSKYKYETPACKPDIFLSLVQQANAHPRGELAAGEGRARDVPDAVLARKRRRPQVLQLRQEREIPDLLLQYLR